MSYNGSGTFLINTAGQPVVSGTVISSTAFNALTADLATGLSTAITKDGQTTVTANIPMGTYKFTGLGAGTAATDSANLSQVQSTVTKLLASVSGADTITAVGSPTLGAYAAGQMFYFIAAGDNTGAVTLNIDSLGAKSVTRDGSVALAAGDIKSGEVVVVVYDGTRFQVVSQINSSGNATFANVSITSALNVGGVATFSAGTAAAPSITTSGDTNNGIFFPATDVTAITTAGSERLRVDASGNLGLGVTPSAWSGFTALQVNNAMSLWSANNDLAYYSRNVYYDGSNRKYVFTGAAAEYIQGAGTHTWHTAPSGSAGGTISFTQAMTLNASGDFGLGTTTPDVFAQGYARNLAVVASSSSSTAALQISGTSASRVVLGVGSTRYGQIYQDSSNFMEIATTAALPIVFSTNNTERGRFEAAGGFVSKEYVKADTYLWAAGVGNAGGVYLGSAGSSNGLISQASAGTTTTTTYIGNQTITTSSDKRLKANIKPTERNALDLLNQWEIVDHTWNDPSDQCENNRNSRGIWTGVVAQQVQPITPWLVNKPLEDVSEDGTINPWVMDFGYSVPLLVKAIQELKAELDAAKVKIAALETK